MTLLGACILWFGWFGFNAGSALGANGLVGERVRRHPSRRRRRGSLLGRPREVGPPKRNPTTLGAASGAVAGLVAITPASGYVGPMSALIIGLIAGIRLLYGGPGQAEIGL